MEADSHRQIFSGIDAWSGCFSSSAMFLSSSVARKSTMSPPEKTGKLEAFRYLAPMDSQSCGLTSVPIVDAHEAHAGVTVEHGNDAVHVFHRVPPKRVLFEGHITTPAHHPWATFDDI